MKKVKAWHFLPASRKLGYNDGRLVVPGGTYTCPGKLELCTNGMHASLRALDALSFRKGPIVCRVVLSGEVTRGPDKLVARSREVLWMADAAEVLRKFARLCALDVLHLWKAPDVVVKYLKTGKEEYRDEARRAAAAAYVAYAAAAAADAAYAAYAAAAADAAYAASAYAAAAADAAYAASAYAAAADAADAAAYADAAAADAAADAADAAYAASAYAADARQELRKKQNTRLTRMLNSLEKELP